MSTNSNYVISVAHMEKHAARHYSSYLTALKRAFSDKEFEGEFDMLEVLDRMDSDVCAWCMKYAKVKTDGSADFHDLAQERLKLFSRWACMALSRIESTFVQGKRFRDVIKLLNEVIEGRVNFTSKTFKYMVSAVEEVVDEIDDESNDPNAQKFWAINELIDAVDTSNKLDYRFESAATSLRFTKNVMEALNMGNEGENQINDLRSLIAG
jgi:hypothetical protein